MVKLTVSHRRSRRARAVAHHAMAYAALASNSSRQVRYRRYSAHMRKAEALSLADTTYEEADAPREVTS